MWFGRGARDGEERQNFEFEGVGIGFLPTTPPNHPGQKPPQIMILPILVQLGNEVKNRKRSLHEEFKVVGVVLPVISHYPGQKLTFPILVQFWWNLGVEIKSNVQT